MFNISPPHNTSAVPDKATKTGLPDHTGTNADGRVLHINLNFFKYGTDDKSHAAAIVFSLIILTMLGSVIVYGMNTNDASPWLEKAFSWLGNAFLLIAGVALGSNGIGSKNSREEEE